MRNRKLKLKGAWLIVFLAGVSLLAFSQELITIEQALDIAEENNPQMITSKLNLEQTLYRLEAQRATLKPQFSLNLNPFDYTQTRSFDDRFSWYTKKEVGTAGLFRAALPLLWTDGTLTLSDQFAWKDSRSDFGGIENNNKAFTNNLNLRFDQPVFTYNRQKMELKRLEFNYENAAISYALQRLNTERNITRQFYNVYMAQENLIISQAEFENAKQNYEITKSKVEADLSAKSELYQAEVNLASAESLVQQRLVLLNNYKDNLKQTLGMPLSRDIGVLANFEISPMIVDQERAIQSGLASRMELRQREISMDVADLDMITVKALNEFKGNVSLQVGILGDNERFGNIYEKTTQNPRVSISLSVPIFDWGEKKARVKAQQTQQTIAKLNYENEKIDIELEVRQTLRNLENYSSQIGIAEKTVRNAEMTYALNQVRYREGEIDGLQISQFQTQLSNAKISLASAKISYKIELLVLKIVSLYDFENDKAIVPLTEKGSAGKR